MVIDQTISLIMIPKPRYITLQYSYGNSFILVYNKHTKQKKMSGKQLRLQGRVFWNSKKNRVTLSSADLPSLHDIDIKLATLLLMRKKNEGDPLHTTICTA